MRCVLIGAVESTRVALEVMIEKGIKPIIITLPLSYSHRHSDFVDLRLLVERFNLELIETSNVNSPEIINIIKNISPDYIFVIGWSQILKKELIELPKRGIIGYHPSLLPKNRGRGVIPWTILLGEKETGSTLFWIDEGIDSGDILIQERIEVDEEETATTLYNKHMNVLRHLFLKALDMLERDNPPRIPQDHKQATYCAKRTAEDGFINWEWPAKKIWTLIRAVTKPYPGAFTFYKEKKIVIWEAELIGNSIYYGLPGQIQKIMNDNIIVSCGDGGCILLKNIEVIGENVTDFKKFFKVHDKLGINFIDLYNRFLKFEGKVI